MRPDLKTTHAFLAESEGMGMESDWLCRGLQWLHFNCLSSTRELFTVASPNVRYPYCHLQVLSCPTFSLYWQFSCLLHASSLHRFSLLFIRQGTSILERKLKQAHLFCSFCWSLLPCSGPGVNDRALIPSPSCSPVQACIDASSVVVNMGHWGYGSFMADSVPTIQKALCVQPSVFWRSQVAKR